MKVKVTAQELQHNTPLTWKDLIEYPNGIILEATPIEHEGKIDLSEEELKRHILLINSKYILGICINRFCEECEKNRGEHKCLLENCCYKVNEVEKEGLKPHGYLTCGVNEKHEVGFKDDKNYCIDCKKEVELPEELPVFEDEEPDKIIHNRKAINQIIKHLKSHE